MVDRFEQNLIPLDRGDEKLFNHTKYDALNIKQMPKRCVGKNVKKSTQCRVNKNCCNFFPIKDGAMGGFFALDRG